MCTDTVSLSVFQQTSCQGLRDCQEDKFLPYNTPPFEKPLTLPTSSCISDVTWEPVATKHEPLTHGFVALLSKIKPSLRIPGKPQTQAHALLPLQNPAESGTVMRQAFVGAPHSEDAMQIAVLASQCSKNTACRG